MSSLLSFVFPEPFNPRALTWHNTTRTFSWLVGRYPPE
jgi:hypothetical protein